MTIADQNPEGIFHEDCYTLAELHSDAVDFPKTGKVKGTWIALVQLTDLLQSVDISRIPREHFRTRPDWCAPENIKPDSSSYYKSQRAIGKLARGISLDGIEPRSTVHRPDFKEGASSKRKMRPGDLEKPLPIPQEVETFLQEDALYLLLHSHLNQFELGLDYTDPETDAQILEIYDRFIDLFENAATTFSISSRSILAEEEVLLGTIAARTALVKDRREKIARLR